MGRGTHPLAPAHLVLRAVVVLERHGLYGARLAGCRTVGVTVQVIHARGGARLPQLFQLVDLRVVVPHTRVQDGILDVQSARPGDVGKLRPSTAPPAGRLVARWLPYTHAYVHNGIRRYQLCQCRT